MRYNYHVFLLLSMIGIIVASKIAGDIVGFNGTNKDGFHFVDHTYAQCEGNEHCINTMLVIVAENNLTWIAIRFR